jgi:hypothetical protein
VGIKKKIEERLSLKKKENRGEASYPTFLRRPPSKLPGEKKIVFACH